MQTATKHIDWQDYVEARALDAHSVVGTLKQYSALYSPQLGNERDLFVHLPSTYHLHTRQYPVIYMHDGQNLFDQALSYTGEWQVDETMELLSHEGYEAIIVGVSNTGPKRTDEYSPFADAGGDGGQGAAYVDFIADTVKPLIDRSFRTLPDRMHTGVIGSSMGGLISIFAFFHRPEIFGLMGAMSPSFWFAYEAVFPFVQRQPFIPGKLYLDAGTEEGPKPPRTLKQRRVGRCARHVELMATILMKKGYQFGSDLWVVEEQGGIHHESAWARRLPDALRFLLPRG